MATRIGATYTKAGHKVETVSYIHVGKSLENILANKEEIEELWIKDQDMRQLGWVHVTKNNVQD